MFTALLGPVASIFTGKLFDSVESIFHDYFQQKISREELMVKLQSAVLATFASVEKEYAESLSQTYQAFMQAASKSKILQVTWATVALSQLFVLFWYQWLVPVMDTWHWFGIGVAGHHFSSPGATVDYAYFLIFFCLGGGAVALKSGPGNNSLATQLKSLIGK